MNGSAALPVNGGRLLQLHDLRLAYPSKRALAKSGTSHTPQGGTIEGNVAGGALLVDQGQEYKIP